MRKKKSQQYQRKQMWEIKSLKKIASDIPSRDSLLIQNAALFQDRQREREEMWGRIAALEKQLEEVKAERDALKGHIAMREHESFPFCCQEHHPLGVKL